MKHSDAAWGPGGTLIDMSGWFRTVAAYPATWFAIALVIVAELLIFTWFDPPLLIALILVALGAFAIISWPITMSATGTLDQLRFPTVDLTAQDPADLEALREDLAELDDPRPLRQLEMLQHKRENLIDVLEKRLDAGEITFSRYLGTAQKVYTSAVNNLSEVAVSLQSVSAIDPQYVDDRLTQLSGTQISPDAQHERSTLESRRSLYAEQQSKVSALLTRNEEALTAIDHTATALADAPMGGEPIDAELAMDELVELAQRAKRYSS